MIWSGPALLPGGSSSSPVAMIATSGRRTTGSEAWLAAAASDERRGIERRGPLRAGGRLRRNRGRRGGCAGRRRRSRAPRSSSSSTARTFSWMAMVSAPSGTGAPVKMRTASPAPTVPANGLPAAAAPDHAQPRRHRCDIGRAHRVAVHGRGGEGRLRAQREQRFGKHAAGRLGERQRFRCRRARHRRAAAGQGLVDRQQRHGQLGPEVAGLAAGFFDQPDAGNHHAAIDGLGHVVDGQAGDATPPSAPPSRRRSCR